ncbi:MAG TPA: MTH1187 family thiamine-binding protein [Longimicrobiales bacterium]|nr:MTH1187 family thiamine-binding protein [Longimicrobiales bacterium]
MLFSLSMFPIGEGSSLVQPVSEVIDEIDKAGLRYEVTGMDTVIEGEWNEVMPVIQRAEQRLREKHDRVYMVLVMDDRPGSRDRLHGAVRDVEEELGRSLTS